MGSKAASLPFPRGSTYFSTPEASTHQDLLGKTYVIEDENFANVGTFVANRTGRYVKVMIVRNSSGGALLPKRLAKMKTDGTAYEYVGEVSGYADTVGQRGYPIDEFLPAAGVAANDLFYVVVGGIATCTTAASGDTNISTGSFVLPATDGKVVDQDLTVSDGQDTTFAALFNSIQGTIGRCVLGVNAANSDILIDVPDRVV